MWWNAGEVFVKKRYWPGEIIPRCAMYLVKHDSHQGTRIVLGTAGDSFPQCKVCGGAVCYEALHLAEYSSAEMLADHPEFIFPTLRTQPSSE